ncbi:glycosyl hydrolase [Balneolales bacterium ANBcel1]|nr:glycosyl hydrolase [Balneolales bacterium ANBcel1]
MRIIEPLFITLIVMLLASCSERVGTGTYTLVDPNANEQTRNLYANLMEMRHDHLLFGHQATLAYGYHWHHSELDSGEERSDVKSVTGSFPAIYGWDIADFYRSHFTEEDIAEHTRQSIAWVRSGFERGGVITYAWHKSNPVTGGSFYDTTRAVSEIIPGGDRHDQYRADLDYIAAFFRELAPIPIIFRPYHEHNGDWFWWGKGLCTEEEFIALWRFTVEYLRDEHQVDNLLYAFSPDRSRMDIDRFHEDYMYGYPGDAYVDIIGIDNYWDYGHPANDTPEERQREHRIRTLRYTVEIANERNKLPALTETGKEAIPDPYWWTRELLEPILTDDLTRQIAYVQVWRNANFERENRDHYYAPFPGQISAENFVEFHRHPVVLFENDLPDMYD